MAVTIDIQIAPAARREIKKLSADAQGRIIQALEKLKLDPRPRGIEKIQGNPDFFRLAVGDFRIIYHIKGANLVVLVARDRKNAYKGIQDIDRKLMAAMNDIYSQSLEIPPRPQHPNN